MHIDFFKIYTSVLVAWALVFSATVFGGPVVKPVLGFTSIYVPVAVQWQLMRNPSQSALTGTVTETYAVEWKVLPGTGIARVQTPSQELDLGWTADAKDLRRGTLLLTRGELVRLLGINAELPQDGRLWQADSPVLVPIQPAGGRSIDPVFRHVDENGAVVIRLAVRLATKP